MSGNLEASIISLPLRFIDRIVLNSSEICDFLLDLFQIWILPVSDCDPSNCQHYLVVLILGVPHNAQAMLCSLLLHSVLPHSTSLLDIYDKARIVYLIEQLPLRRFILRVLSILIHPTSQQHSIIELHSREILQTTRYRV